MPKRKKIVIVQRTPLRPTGRITDKLLGRGGLDLSAEPLSMGRLRQQEEQLLSLLDGQVGLAIEAASLMNGHGNDIAPLAPALAVDPLLPTSEEALRTREMIHTIFGEFGQAGRVFVFAKHADRQLSALPEALQQFMESDNVEWPSEEMRRLGWKEASSLLSRIAGFVVKMDQQEQHVRRTAARPMKRAGFTITPEQVEENVRHAREFVRNQDVVPALVRYFKEKGLCDPDMGDDALARKVRETAEDYEKLAVSMMHEHRGALMEAVRKRVHHVALSDEEQRLLAANAELVAACMAEAESAGRGVATPCNQLFRVMEDALKHWNEYSRIAVRAERVKGAHKPYIAQQLMQEAMGEHAQALKGFRLFKAPLEEVCTTLHKAIDPQHNPTTLAPGVLDKAMQLVASLPDIGGDLDYHVQRMESARKGMDDVSQEQAWQYCNKLANAWGMAFSLNLESDKLNQSVAALRQESPDGESYDTGSEAYRKVFFSLRNIQHQMDMMLMSTKDLYVEMAHVTGKNPNGWSIPAEEKHACDTASPSSPPCQALKSLAERVQFLCSKLHGEAEEKRTQLQPYLDALGAKVDRLDIALDVFERLQSGSQEIIAAMEGRERAWQGRQGAAKQL